MTKLRQELRGERTGIRYAIGTRVRVQVSRVDLDGRRIDFRLVQDGVERLVRAMKDKGSPHESQPRGARVETAADDAPRRKSRKGTDAAPRGRKAAGAAGKASPRSGATGKKSRSPRR